MAKLRNAGYSLNLSDSNLPEVKEHLHIMAEKVRKKIANEVKGRAIELMVDIAKRNNRSIIGASIQYIANGKLKVRSIAMIELHEAHTAKYLAEIICVRLKVFEIDLRQILTITTDNGSNVLKMIKDVEDYLQKAIAVENETPTKKKS